MMKSGRVQMNTDADVKRSSVPFLLDEQIDNPLDTTLFEDDRVKYGSDTDVIVTIAPSMETIQTLWWR